MAGQMLSRKCIFFSFSEIKHLHIVNRNLNSRRVIPADANHILTARLYSPPVTCKPFKSSFDVNDGNLRVPFQFNFFRFFFFVKIQRFVSYIALISLFYLSTINPFCVFSAIINFWPRRLRIVNQLTFATTNIGG